MDSRPADGRTGWTTGVELLHSPVGPLSNPPLSTGMNITKPTARCSGGISDARFS